MSEAEKIIAAVVAGLVVLIPVVGTFFLQVSARRASVANTPSRPSSRLI
jgi:hypothetical protein